MSTITGTMGNDLLVGTSGDDVIDGVGGVDRIDAGAGADRILVNPPPLGSVAYSLIDGGAGHDILDLTRLDGKASLYLFADGSLLAGQLNRVGPDTIFGFVAEAHGCEEIHLGAAGGGVAIDGDGPGQSGPRVWTIVGNDGVDVITVSGMHATTLIADGGGGADKIAGADGDDWINGGGNDAGADTLSGMGGNDHIFGNTQSAMQGAADGGDLIDAGAGSDYVNGNAGNDTIHGGAGSDRLFGGSGDDRIVGDNDVGIDPDALGFGNDHLNGNQGNDTLIGGFGKDELRGGQGDDLLDGGEQDDVLNGDRGNDILDGGGGVDTLTGGSGADIFRFRATAPDSPPYAPVDGTRTDEIADFEHGADHIQLGFHVAAMLQAGTASGFLAAFHVADDMIRAHGGEQEVAAVQVGSDTYLFFAGDGVGALDSVIEMRGMNAILFGVSDFG